MHNTRPKADVQSGAIGTALLGAVEAGGVGESSLTVNQYVMYQTLRFRMRA